MNAAPGDQYIIWRGTRVPHAPAHHEWFVYLLHFDTAYKHAKHYLGSTGCLEARLARHRSGNGARLVEVITQAGLTFRLARLWRCASEQEARALEKRLKGWHGSAPLCPMCRPDLPIDDETFQRIHGFARALTSRQQVRPRKPL